MSSRPCLWMCLALSLTSAPALGADVKRECVDASTEGQTSRDAGELLKSRDQFLLCSRDACPAVVRSSCIRWLSAVEQQLPSIVIRAADAANADITDGTATVDGVKFPLDGKPILLDPGKHVVSVDTDGGVHLEKKLLLAAGEKSRLIELRVPAPKETPVDAPAREPTARATTTSIPTGAWVLGGVGIVALGSFGFFAISAKNELDQLNDVCAPSCAESKSDTGRKNALIADVSLGVGVVALAGAVTWAVLGSSQPAPNANAAQLSLAPRQGGGYAAVSGRF